MIASDRRTVKLAALAAAAASSCWLILAPAASAQGNFGVWEVDRATKSEIQVFSPFEAAPNRGFFPVKAVIRNGFERDLVWNFSFMAGADGSDPKFESSFQVIAPERSETEHEFMVPLPPLFIDAYNNEVSVTVTGPGGRFRGSISNPFQYHWPSIGFSQGLDQRRNLDLLQKEIETSASSTSIRFGSGQSVAALFDATKLTSDWRGYTGFDVLMMSDKEWQTLEPAIRSAMLAWIRLGGHLHIFSTTPGAKPGTFGIDVADTGEDSAANAPSERSLGQVWIHTWDGKDLPLARLRVLLDGSPRLAVKLEEDFIDSWPIQAEFGQKPFNPVAMFIILIAFAIMVGPINLFVLAKPGMRHRMFYTTPIISLGASLLLVFLIIFKDGFGGSGLRCALMMLQSNPDERRAYIVQEELARTGVLLGRSFSLDEPAFISPGRMRQSRWTHFDNGGGGNVRGTYRYHNMSLAGDWFQSRSEQAHFSETVRPTRARIERLADADGAPTFFSSVEFTLEQLYFVDVEGQVWKSPGAISPGQEVVLQTVGGEPGDLKGVQALKTFWKEETKRFTKRLNERIQDFPNRRNLFLAVARDPADQLIPTLGSIRWSDDKLVVVGEPVPRASQPQPQPGDAN